MSLQDQLDALLDAAVIDSAGVKVGRVERIYLDDVTGKATFATVSTGIFSADSTIPLYGAQLLEGEVHVDHTKQIIKNAPHMKEIEDGLSPDVEADLCEYFGIDLPASTSEPAEESPSTPEPVPAGTDEPTDAASSDTTDSDSAASRTADSGATEEPESEGEADADGDTDADAESGTDTEHDDVHTDADTNTDAQTATDDTDPEPDVTDPEPATDDTDDIEASADADVTGPDETAGDDTVRSTGD